MSDDRWLERVAEKLRAPVEPSPGFDARILDAVRSVRRPSRRLGLWLGATGLAAAAAIAAVFLAPSPPRPPVSPSFETTSVIFELSEPAARRVALVGDFNDWDQARTPLARDGERWRATVALPTGIYRYAFLIDGVRWVADPGKPGPEDADFGQPISLLAME